MSKTRRTTAKAKTAKARSRAPMNAPRAVASASRKPRSRTIRATTSSKADSGKHQSKKATIQTLLQRPEGASIVELSAATGWQSHSVRAALTGLRKHGHEIDRRGEGGASRYRIIKQRKAAKS